LVDLIEAVKGRRPGSRANRMTAHFINSKSHPEVDPAREGRHMTVRLFVLFALVVAFT
jgi:hypothetical protein